MHEWQYIFHKNGSFEQFECWTDHDVRLNNYVIKVDDVKLNTK